MQFPQNLNHMLRYVATNNYDYFEYDVYKIQTTFNPLYFYENRKKYFYRFLKKITNMRDVLTLSSHNGLTTYMYKYYIDGTYKFKQKYN